MLPSHHWCKYFNSRPREGADRQELVARLLYKNISTHGPARGPTGLRHYKALESGISTHGPARGPTLHASLWPLSFWNFNSRPREGADLSEMTARKPLSYFNSRPREGADFNSAAFQEISVISTHGPARGPTSG